MKTLTPEELASGEWIWDEGIDDFVNVNAPRVPDESKPDEDKEEPKIPTHAIEGMRWNGTKLS